MATILIDPDGEAHLPGCSLNTFETLCGAVDAFTEYETTTGTPTCRGCIIAAQDVLKVATAKEIKAWRVI